MEVKEAVTFLVALSVTVQLAVPLHAPDQPLKVAPLAGVAVRVTAVPLVNEALQVLPQLMPLGLLLMVPLPVTVVDKMKDCGGGTLVRTIS